MKKLTLCALALLFALPALSQQRRATELNFASDFQTVPVMANTTGVNGARFQSYVALMNPTASAISVAVALYDANGTKRDATISLAAGEQKTYTNFLDDVFHTTGGGAATFSSPNNRFIVTSEIRTAGASYSTPIPVVEFAGTSSRAFSAGVTVDTSSRTNVGCFNQSASQNVVRARIYDKSGQLLLGTTELSLAPNAWGQTGVNTVVSDGFVRFEPSEAAVCYAVVVNNASSDGRFITAAEFQP